MNDPIIMTTPDPSDHAARARVFLDNIHDRMRGGTGDELRTPQQKDLMATEALAHAVLALNDTLRGIFPTGTTTTHGTSDPQPRFDTTPVPPGPIPGVEHYVEGISDVADYAPDNKPEPVAVLDLNSDVSCATAPDGIPGSHWHQIVSAAATGRATGSIGAKALITDGGDEIEYAIKFRTKVSDDQWKIVSTTPVGDVTRRIIG